MSKKGIKIIVCLIIFIIACTFLFKKWDNERFEKSFHDPIDIQIIRQVSGKTDDNPIQYDDYSLYWKISGFVIDRYDASPDGVRGNLYLNKYTKEEWLNYFEYGVPKLKSKESWQKNMEYTIYRFFKETEYDGTLTLDILYEMLTHPLETEERDTLINISNWVISKGSDIETQLKETSKSYTIKYYTSSNIPFGDLSIEQIIEFENTGVIAEFE